MSLSRIPRTRSSRIGARTKQPALLAALAALFLGSLGTPAAAQSPSSPSRAGGAAGETVDVEGVLTLRDGGKPTRREVQLAVVWYEPDEPSAAAAEKASAGNGKSPDETEYVISMVRKEFQPRVLAVPSGSRVSFPNNDGILHNAFSRSGRNRFDLELYRRGESRDVQLDHPGIVQVFCNVHHSMVAHVVVLDTPYYAYPDRDGRFTLEGLPPGKGHLVLWHERAEEKRIPFTVPRPGAAVDMLAIDLDASKPRVPPHRNKFGKPYQRRRRGKAY